MITDGFDRYGTPISDFGLVRRQCGGLQIADCEFHVFETIITDGFVIYGHNPRIF